MPRFRIFMHTRMQPRTEPGRDERHRAILDLLAAHKVRNQAELQDLLARRGFEVNQATLSRDLRHLGILKSGAGYELPGAPQAAASPAQSLWHGVQAWLLRATAAQNQCVVHTPPSGAQPLGRVIDEAELPGVVGTIAGDDTVLVICRDARAARALARQFGRLKAT